MPDFFPPEIYLYMYHFFLRSDNLTTFLSYGKKERAIILNKYARKDHWDHDVEIHEKY